MGTAYFQTRAVGMAEIQGRYLLRGAASLGAAGALTQAAGLVRDWVLHLDRPRLAIAFALDFHRMVERWSIWPSWISALDLVLTLDRAYFSDAERIRLLNCRSQAARAMGDADQALRDAAEALRMAEMCEDLGLIAEAHLRISGTAYLRDDFAGAREHLEQAYLHGKEVLSRLELGNIRMNLGTIAMHEGRLADAHRHYDEALDLYRVADEPISVAKVQGNRAELLRLEGRPQDAMPELIAARDLLRSAEARYDYALAENDLGCLYLSLSKWERALAAFQVGLAELEAIGSLSGKALVLSNLAELYVTTAQWDKAVPALDEARELAELSGRDWLAAAVEVDRGRMLAARGDYRGARAVWEIALRVHESKGATLAAQTTRRLIEGLPVDGG